jgi:hypothetical protein
MLSATVYADAAWAAVFAIITVSIGQFVKELNSAAVAVFGLIAGIFTSAGATYFFLSAAVRAFTPVITEGFHL